MRRASRWGSTISMATRRAFFGLAASAAALAAGAIPARAAAPGLMSAAHLKGSEGGVVWRESAVSPFALPARGHALSRIEDGKVVVIGRRPGLYSAIVDPARLDRPAKAFAASDGNRFAGHAAVSRDMLVTGEFDAVSVRAVLVARDPATGAERATWTLDEIEPHELLFSGDRLFAALGGLVKDGGVSGPAVNDRPLRSAVVEIDPHSGKVLARHATEAALSSLSLRHLARASDGAIAVAAQDQDLSEPRPLVGLIAPGGTLKMLAMPRDAGLRGYVGAVAFDAKGELIAAASPRGGVVGVWSRDGWHGAIPIADACGIAAGAEPDVFWVSSGHGGVYRVDARALTVLAEWHGAPGFDNHMIVV